jgi:predicted RNA methylase
MKLRHIESQISSWCRITDFYRKPNIELEQYSTSPHLAASIVSSMENQYDAIQGRSVVDVGCGCGVLSAAVCVLEPDFLLCVDLDEKCIEITQSNLSDVEVPIDYLRLNVSQHTPAYFNYKHDTAIMNPPFGTRRKGADIEFLLFGLSIANQVFSLHKSSTRGYIQKLCDSKGIDAEVVATMRYDLPKLYKMHKKKSVDIEVDFWHLSNEEL